MTVSQQPLNVRNNNPGNLRFVGQPGATQGEGGFARFETPQAGFEAMRSQIELDTQTRGLNLTQFLNKYAPPSENKTTNYIDFVAKKTGLDPSAPVPASAIPQLQMAMIEMEGGPRSLSYFQGLSAPPRQVAPQPSQVASRTPAQGAPVQLAAANLPQNYRAALAATYLGDTESNSVTEQAMELLEEVQSEEGGGGAGAFRKKLLSALTPQETEVDPFALMQKAQQPAEQKRKTVPRMPVMMANGGLAQRAMIVNRPRMAASDYTKLTGIQKDFENYNRQVEDYQKAIDAYNAKVEAYNAAGGEGVEHPGDFTTAEPTTPSTTPEQAEALQKQAQARAGRFYAARNTALQNVVDPRKYNLAGMGFSFKNGGIVHRQAGSPEEGEVAAQQMTVGTLPTDQKPAGQVFRGIGRDVVRGAQYLPYDILGAPVDIATMAMRPFGYNVEKPFLGSEYLIERSRQAGIADQPTGSAAETATRIGMGFVNPAAVARQIPRGIAAIQRGAEALELPGIAKTAPVGAVKPTGGVVNADEMVDSLTRIIKYDMDLEKQDPQKFYDIFKWIDTKARNYYEKQFGSPSDPLFRSFLTGDFNPQFDYLNDSVRSTYEESIKHARTLFSSTSTANQKIGRAMLGDLYDKVTPLVAQYGPQTIQNRLLNPKFREEIQRYIMEERNLGPTELTPKAQLDYEKQIDSYLDEFAKTGKLSTKAPFDVIDINKATSQNIIDDIGNKVETQTAKLLGSSDEMYGFLRPWPGHGAQLEKTHALPSAYSKNYPDYLATTAERQAVKFGEPTYYITKQPEEVHADLNNLIGYLNRTPSDEWKNTSFPDLVVKAQKDYANITDPQEIYKRLNNYQKVTPKQRLIGTQEFMPVQSKQLGEGATWRELDENGILIEGRLLRHCLSEDEKYANFYKNGMSRFFALRDKDGKSYATIQIDQLGTNGPFANVHQIKGWKNNSVGKKYDKEIMDFLNHYQTKEINVPLRYTEESSFLPTSLAEGERVRLVEGDAPFIRRYVEFFRTLDRNLIDRNMATPEDLGDFNYVLDRMRDLPTETQQKEFVDTFLKAFGDGFNKPLKFIYQLGGWRTAQLGEPQPVWQNPPVNRAKGGMVDKPLYDRAT